MTAAGVARRVHPTANISFTTPGPLLSVVVPAINLDLELRRCLDSVRLALPDVAQCEIVLVVPACLVQAAASTFPEVRVVAESRPSVYAAMNDGVAASSGRYLYFLGKDDILLPAAREVVGLLIREEPAVVFADVYWGSDGLRRGSTSRWKILFRNVCHQGIVYSRAVFAAHGPYVRRLRVRADHLLNIRVLRDFSLSPRTLYIGVPLAWYAASGLSFTVPDTTFYRIHASIIGRYLGPVAACAWRTYRRWRPEKGMP
jgi:glycosyltransferase involved in cell wall biosynthesis